MRSTKLSVFLSLSIGGALVTPLPGWAQEVPRSFVASPEVYKVIAEDEKYRVIAVVWKAGQRDAWHSHGTPVGVYNLTDCTMRIHTPDGKTVDNNSKAGDARVRTQAPSHSLENVGWGDCRLVLFEPKN